MKAMILAAGLGQRMKPLSDGVPKPLLKVGNECLIERHLIALKASGINEIVINVSYHASQFMELLGHGERFGVNIIYSYENPGPLGTGGGIYHALPWLGDTMFIIVAGDIWTDYSFATLLNQQHGQDAHLVMVKNPSFHPEGDYGLLNNENVTLNGPKYTYGCIALLHPHLFADQQSGTYPLAPLLNKSIIDGRVTGELYNGIWHNLGTPQQLEELRKGITI